MLVHDAFIRQVRYTTYDLRREYDTITLRTHPDIMVLSGETRPLHQIRGLRHWTKYHSQLITSQLFSSIPMAPIGFLWGVPRQRQT
jgi:hypothetical protein